MSLQRITAILGLFTMLAYGADGVVSPTDQLITSADQICVVTVESLDGNASPMGMSSSTLVGKVDRTLKGKLKKGQSITVKWATPDNGQPTAEQKRRKVKEGEKFIVFLMNDPSGMDNQQRQAFVLSDPWVGFQPDNTSFTDYITARLTTATTPK